MPVISSNTLPHVEFCASPCRSILGRMAVAQKKASSEARANSLRPARGTILGVDYGRAGIGLAVANEEGGLARPLTTLVRKNRNADMKRLQEIVREHGVKEIVVGLPLRMDGAHGEMAAEAARFAERIRKRTGVPVEMIDERLTSWEAERIIHGSKGKRRGTVRAENARRRSKVSDSMDAVAAAVILREYLERTKATKERD